MDIKLKNIKYSIVTKGIAVFVIWFCVMTAALSAGFWLYNQEAITTDYYYETYSFVSEYSSLIYDVTELKVKFHEEEGTAVSTATPTTETPNRERILTIKSKLANTVNFAYYIKNSKTGEIISNINDADRVALLKRQPTYIYIGKGNPDTIVYSNKGRYNDTHVTGMKYYYEISRLLEGTPYEVYTAIIEPMKPGDMFYDGFLHYSQVKSIAPAVTPALVISIILILAALIYLIYAAGRKEKGGEIILAAVDRMYVDVFTALVFITAIISFILVTGTVNSFGKSMLTYIITAVILSIDALLGLSYILSAARQIKNKQILRNTLLYKLFKLVKGFIAKVFHGESYNKLRRMAISAFSGKTFKPWILLVLLGYGLINGILFPFFVLTFARGMLLSSLAWGFIFIAFNITALYFTSKALVNLTQIMEAVKEVSAGNLDYSLNKEEISVAFLGLADDLQGLQKGLKNAVSEAVKGERMKTELITNVSHDLKTPLTSIINYVDLLKKEELNNENAREYIAVLDEKSARLKQLVEDLIEASKASSGNLSVNVEKIDLHQLVMQAYGEYEEKLEAKDLDMRISDITEDIFVNADGRHLWRVVENLLSNVLKYSMPKSRVYVNLDKNEHYGILTIKNISAFPLEISPEQLTERFVRGDSSRSTEGSGLGLSIAQGLTQLQSGSFKVEIDGDLFKVIVEIPLWREL